MVDLDELESIVDKSKRTFIHHNEGAMLISAIAELRILRDESGFLAHQVAKQDEVIHGMRAALKAVEWGGYSKLVNEKYCPFCTCYLSKGHGAGCLLAAALAGSTAVEVETDIAMEEEDLAGHTQPAPSIETLVERLVKPDGSWLEVHHGMEEGECRWQVRLEHNDETLGEAEGETVRFALSALVAKVEGKT